MRNRAIRTWIVTIGSVEKYLTDNAFENGWITPLKVEKNIEKENSIGVIGAGPAGLAAAEELRKKVTRFMFMIVTIEPVDC